MATGEMARLSNERTGLTVSSVVVEATVSGRALASVTVAQ
jgi:hypothetical protein